MVQCEEYNVQNLVLDFDSESGRPLVSIDSGLAQVLKSYQIEGVKFMWNACFESIKTLSQDIGGGCILAHCMGLGKYWRVYWRMMFNDSIHFFFVVCREIATSVYPCEFVTGTPRD